MIRRDSANSTVSTRSSCTSLREKARPASPVESVPSSSSSGRKRYESPYPAPSIDSTISSPPRSPPPSSPSPSRYVSFDEILQNAGYEHTRIITPPSEKQRRRILQFDDTEEGRYEPGEEPHADINTHVNWHRSHDLMRYAVFKHERAEAERLAKESSGVLGKSWKDRIFRMPAHEEQKPSPKGEKKFKEAAKALPEIGLGLNKGGQGMRRALSQRSLKEQAVARGLDSPAASDDGTATIRPERRTRPVPFGDASARENSLSTPVKIRSGDLKNKVLVAKVTDTPSSPSTSKTSTAANKIVARNVAGASAPSPTTRPKRPALPTAESDDSQLTIVPPDDQTPDVDDTQGHYVEEDLGEDLSVDGMDVFDTSMTSTTVSTTPPPVLEGFTSRFAWDGGFGFSSSHSADDLKMLMSRFDEFGREMQEIEAANAAQEVLARQQREGSSESPALRKFRSWHFPTRRPDDTFRLADYDDEVIEDAPSTALPSSETYIENGAETSSPIDFGPSGPSGLVLEDNGYGYEPLPADYDAMEDDDMYGDEVLREINSYRGTDSTRSSTPESASVRSNQTSSTRSVADSVRAQHVELTPDTSLESEEAFGKRVLETAVAYDGYESPESLHESLPDIETILNGGQAQAGPSTSRTIQPSKPTETTSLLPRKKPEPTASQKLVKQYQSTPALTKRKTWAESLREGFMASLGYPAPPEPLPAPVPVLKTKESKFKLSSPSIASAQVTVYPVTCDTTASAPPVEKFRAVVDTPPRPSSPTATPTAANGTSLVGQVGAGVLRARKSLSALSAQIGLSSEDKPAETYLAPQSMWYTDGVMFKAWDKRWARESPELSTSEDRRFELDTPYRRNMGGSTHRTFENDGFWFPDPIPQAPTPKRQTSIDRLKHHLTWGPKEVAPPPPVPLIPARFQKAKRTSGAEEQSSEPSSSSGSGGRTTPTLAPTRLAKVPSLILMSPGAYEEGRPGRELVLDGPEFEAREVSKKRGVRRKGSKKGMGKKKAATTSGGGIRPMGSGAMFAQHQDAGYA